MCDWRRLHWLSTALELAERGVSVVLLEGARLGWAASGRNGGQVLSDLACGMDAVRAELGAGRRAPSGR